MTREATVLAELRALAHAARDQANTATTDYERARQLGRLAGYEQAIEIITRTPEGPMGLSPKNEALVASLKKHLAISPELADLLWKKWAQANLLLDAAREEGVAEAEARPHH